MPIYEYVCPSCNIKFELLRSLNQATEEASCPHCQCKAERKLSTFAAVSKDETGYSTPLSSSCSSCSSLSCDSCGA